MTAALPRAARLAMSALVSCMMGSSDGRDRKMGKFDQDTDDRGRDARDAISWDLWFIYDYKIGAGPLLGPSGHHIRGVRVPLSTM